MDGLTPNSDRFATDIGEKLRQARKARGLTLGALAAQSGLSQAFLSRLERGQTSTTIATLLDITAALGLPMHELFAPEAAATAPYEVFRAAGQAASPTPKRGAPPQTVKASGYTWQPVAGGRRGQAMEAFLLTFPTGAAPDTRVAHDGEEVCYVLDGAVRFRVGEDTIELGPGDAIHLESSIPHMAENLGSTPARVLMITAGPGNAGPSFDWWTVAHDFKDSPHKGDTP